MNRLADEIDAALARLSNQSTARVRSVRRDYSKRLRSADPGDVIEAAIALRKRGGLIRHFVACELVHHHRAARERLSLPQIERFAEGLDGWAAVDCFAYYVSGPAWREGRVPDRWVTSLAKSRDPWRRRAALASTIPLNSKTHGGKGDAARTVRVCGMLADDREDLVVKALSWALRELSKRDALAVRQFLRREEKRLAPRVLREVANKLRTGLKNP